MIYFTFNTWFENTLKQINVVLKMQILVFYCHVKLKTSEYLEKTTTLDGPLPPSHMPAVGIAPGL